MWSSGTTRSGSSSDAIVTSISSGSELEQNVNGVPHAAQKLRVPWSLDRKLFGAPRVIRKSPRRPVTHATLGAPLALRQIVQWHTVACQSRPRSS